MLRRVRYLYFVVVFTADMFLKIGRFSAILPLILIRQRLKSLSRPAAILIALWVLAMILVPIQLWLFGDGVLPFAITLATLLQAGSAIAVLGSAWGWRRVLTVMAVALPLAWAFEFIGHTTGFPFGGYDYTPRLQPQIGGVPFILPFAWFMMLPSSWAIAQITVTRLKWTGWQRWVAFCAVAAVAMTAWDLFLDPQMVNWNLWTWENVGQYPSTYFGIPWVNFAGWLLASFTITAAASALYKPNTLPVRPLLFIYGICWALEWGGLIFFWGLPGPGIVGFFAMGGVLAASLWLLRGRTPTFDPVAEPAPPLSATSWAKESQS